MRQRHKFVSAFVFSLLVGTSLSFSSTEANGVDGSSEQDAIAYSKAFGVDLAEAVREMDWATQAATLESELHSRELSFSGLWIGHQPFHVSVAFTGKAGDTLAAYSALIPTGMPVVARTLPHSQVELESAAASVLAAHVTADVNVDVIASVVHVVSPTPDVIRSKLAATAVDESMLEVEAGDLAKPAANFYGGLTISACTSGFSVANTNTGALGFVTAAHCSNTQTYQGNNLPYQLGSFFGPNDEQWHTTPTYADRAWFNDGLGTIRVVHQVFGRDQVALGQFLCKYGYKTGYTYLEERGTFLHPKCHRDIDHRAQRRQDGGWR